MHTRYIILQYHYHGILLHILLSCRITVLINICNMSTLLKTLVSDSEQMRYILPGDIVNQQCLHHCRTRILDDESSTSSTMLRPCRPDQELQLGRLIQACIFRSEWIKSCCSYACLSMLMLSQIPSNPIQSYAI